MKSTLSVPDDLRGIRSILPHLVTRMLNAAEGEELLIGKLVKAASNGDREEVYGLALELGRQRTTPTNPELQEDNA